jgi:gas vesicle protein
MMQLIQAQTITLNGIAQQMEQIEIRATKGRQEQQQALIDHSKASSEQHSQIAGLVHDVPNIAKRIAKIEENGSELSSNMKEQLDAIMAKLDAIQTLLKDDLKPRVEQAEKAVTDMRQEVSELKKRATQEQTMPIITGGEAAPETKPAPVEKEDADGNYTDTTARA